MPPGSHRARLTALNVCAICSIFSSFALKFCHWIIWCLDNDKYYCIGSSYGVVLSNAFRSWCVSFSTTYLVSAFMKFSLCAVSMSVDNYVFTVYSTLVVSLARFRDNEDMLEDTWHIEFSRRPDISDTFYPNVNGGLPMWETYPLFQSKPKKEENLGLAEAITNCILSTGKFFYYAFLHFMQRFEALFNCLVLYSQVA